MSSAPIPDRIIVTESPDELMLAYRWSDRMEAIFTIVFGVILVVVFTRVAQSVLCIPLIGIAGYWVAGNVFNQTTFRVTHKTLAKIYKPVPWPGGQAVAMNEIRNLCCKLYGKGSDSRYCLEISLKNGKKIEWMADHGESARCEIEYIVKRIQDWLGWRYQLDDMN